MVAVDWQKMSQFTVGYAMLTFPESSKDKYFHGKDATRLRLVHAQYFTKIFHSISDTTIVIALVHFIVSHHHQLVRGHHT